MTDRELMQQALAALESDPISHAGLVSRKQAITALRQALETEQEPLYWNVADGWVYADDTSQKRVDEKAKREHEWVGLTDDEIMEPWPFETRIAFARWLESKIKEKNCGH